MDVEAAASKADSLRFTAATKRQVSRTASAAPSYSGMRGSVLQYFGESEPTVSLDNINDTYLSRTPTDNAMLPTLPNPKAAAASVAWWQSVAIYSSVLSNVILLAIKIVALLESDSLAMLAAVLDSAMDILAGLILFVAARARRGSSSSNFPIGMRRVSPIATLVFSCIMSMAAVQVVIEAGTVLINGLSGGNKRVVLVPPTVIAIVVTTISLKLALAVLCSIIGKMQKNTIISAYAQDHMNDTMTNTVSIAGMILAAK